MSTKTAIASFAVELTEDENGSPWITVTRQAPSEDSFVQPVTATSLVIYETILKLLNELQSIYANRQLYRC